MLNILIIGSSNNKGLKIARFLTNKGYAVFGVDRFPKDAIEGFIRFFRMDFRHKDNMQLAMAISKPYAVIYCGDNLNKENSFSILDYNFIAYWNLLSSSVENEVKKIILCTDDIFKTPQTPYEVSRGAMCLMTEVFSKKFDLESLIITDKLNLLKEIKKFLINHKYERGVEKHE